MPSVRDLRDRIRSLKNTQQITKAMKQVAAAKIRRAEALQKQSRPYADAIGAMLRDLIANVGTVDHPFMKPGAASAPDAVIVMTADKGLAGSFNANLIRSAEIHAREHGRDLAWYSVGIKGRNALRRQRGETLQFWPLAQGDMFANAQELANRVSADFTEGRIGSLTLISPKLVNMMTQRPEVRQLLPITSGEPNADGAPKGGAVEFEPSPEFVLGRLLPKYLEFTLYSAMLETNASFYAAQLVAMNNATDNAKKLIDQNTVEMNKARQAAITKEILEIVGGAEALAG
ncbi:MAG TPA: ATP synthase F1 subunit gamma [Candidatus Elarobacter sp.]|nr:ATP synthase F1 subunit gamma [Candidatus Elarobacter sp.]